ncbi:cyclic nucleotide-binding domain-containing protein [Archangium primigenium]|uniref:cyclic nucleotide-binding domain-containing protein n=1 Tax=[Archangium] primigenium TaxID=2792470 RepID=UPI001959D33B|nr:cyclic nucleotide-binding domain-containing protein [Archangium primigenium]MBM7118329.1 cyclic nucleotide-binding domain-containing protein [Archangium primigenium]
MEKLAVVSSSQLFDMLSSAELLCLAELAEQRDYTAGEVVFEEGELGDSLYVIVRGELEVVRREEDSPPRALKVLGPPEFFGEMSLIDKEYRSATVRARTDARLLRLTAQHLATFRQEYRDGFTFIVINIARSLSARVREANARLGARRP